MASISERALCEVIRRLQRIRKEDGYGSDAGREVNFSFFGDGKCDSLSVWDGGETNTAPAGHPHKIVLNIDVDAVALANQSETGERVGAMKADIKRAVLAPGIGRLKDDAGNIGPIRYAGATVRPRDPGHLLETLTLNFVVDFVEGCGNPESPQTPETSR